MRNLLALTILAITSACFVGCSNTKTSWEAGGDYQATLTIDDSTGTALGQVYRTGGYQTEDEVEMCSLRNVTWGIPFSTAVRGHIAAIRTTLPQPLCRIGSYNVSTGTVLTWQPVGSDTSTVSAQPAAGWTVSGSVTVDEYTRLNHPEPKVDQRLLNETSTGTFALEAHGPSGEIVRFQNGTYQFDIYIRKDPYNPFD